MKLPAAIESAWVALTARFDALAMPGLDQLIQRLRQAPLQVRVGTSEAIDAARLLAHLAAQPGVDDPTLETLRLRLRPVLCKAAGDLDHFNAAFDAWAQEVQAARGAPDALPPSTGIEGTRGTGHTDRSVKPVDPTPPRPGVAPTKAGATTPPAAPVWRQPWF